MIRGRGRGEENGARGNVWPFWAGRQGGCVHHFGTSHRLLMELWGVFSCLYYCCYYYYYRIILRVFRSYVRTLFLHLIPEMIFHVTGLEANWDWCNIHIKE